MALYDEPKPEELKLINGDRSVQVGDLAGTALDQKDGAFPAPQRSYQIQNLPSQFPPEFQAQGWETGNGEGFGVILAPGTEPGKGRIVGAVYQLEKTQKEAADQRRFAQASVLKSQNPTVIGTGHLEYWFWTTKDQIEMICEYVTKEGVNFTVALGDKNVMKALGISEEDARTEIRETDRIERRPINAAIPR